MLTRVCVCVCLRVYVPMCVYVCVTPLPRGCCRHVCLYCPQDRGCGHVPNALRSVAVIKAVDPHARSIICCVMPRPPRVSHAAPRGTLVPSTLRARAAASCTAVVGDASSAIKGGIAPDPKPLSQFCSRRSSQGSALPAASCTPAERNDISAIRRGIAPVGLRDRDFVLSVRAQVPQCAAASCTATEDDDNSAIRGGKAFAGLCDSSHHVIIMHAQVSQCARSSLLHAGRRR
jgi:hypothetical protein